MNDESIRRLLEESDLPDDDALESALGDLRDLARTPAPAPSLEVAARMRPRRRRLGRRGGAVVTLAVVATLGTGLSAAALTPGVPQATFGAVQHLVGGGAAPAPQVPTIGATTTTTAAATPSASRAAAAPAASAAPATSAAAAAARPAAAAAAPGATVAAEAKAKARASKALRTPKSHHVPSPKATLHVSVHATVGTPTD
ncbi:hypothetical protein QDR37_02370 [Amnibacterium sp. CER49]|uniref:hypothetical protein n=1 Tax=Amnibacterium sp. CER49 TaxID=3039161 RepID=UPI00244BC3D4|nr:hypothetical protein [Amnibacterium sp. CER49]MDH2442782.1 hypothetical protein [Amnibacterium sp. CER49]